MYIELLYANRIRASMIRRVCERAELSYQFEPPNEADPSLLVYSFRISYGSDQILSPPKPIPWKFESLSRAMCVWLNAKKREQALSDHMDSSPERLRVSRDLYDASRAVEKELAKAV